MFDERERIAQRFLIERMGVEVGNLCSTLDHLSGHLLLRGDVRTRVTVDVVYRRLRDIQEEARKASERLNTAGSRSIQEADARVTRSSSGTEGLPKTEP